MLLMAPPGLVSHPLPVDRSPMAVWPATAAGAGAQDEVPAEMQARAEAVFTRLARALAPEYDIAGEYTIQVVHERVPNAWINQDHEIYVSTGLMELLTTDDQLAGVIGHEIAHGTQGHIPHRINQSLWSAFAVLALGTVASSSGAADWGGLLHMRDLFMFAYSREQESEADLVGLGYARAAGYEAEGLVEALELMERERRRLPSDSVWQDLYRSHPPIPQRVSDLRFVLMNERLRHAPLSSSSMLTRRSAAASAEDAAVQFVQALLSGNVDAVDAMMLPGGSSEASTQLGTRLESMSDIIDVAWADGAGEIVSRGRAVGGQTMGFDETLVVRLSRPAGTGNSGGTPTSPAVAVTVRRSAAGWFVTSWTLVDG